MPGRRHQPPPISLRAARLQAADVSPQPPSRSGSAACLTASSAAATHSGARRADTASSQHSQSLGPTMPEKLRMMAASCRLAASWTNAGIAARSRRSMPAGSAASAARVASGVGAQATHLPTFGTSHAARAAASQSVNAAATASGAPSKNTSSTKHSTTTSLWSAISWAIRRRSHKLYSRVPHVHPC
eukprot:SAG22_NODE_4147_length_1368_cov_0.936958_3_plen_187_part_00